MLFGTIHRGSLTSTLSIRIYLDVSRYLRVIAPTGEAERCEHFREALSLHYKVAILQDGLTISGLCNKNALEAILP